MNLLDCFQRLAEVARYTLHCSRLLQFGVKPHCVRMRATKHLPRDQCQILERLHGLAEIGERGAVVEEERPRVTPPHPGRGVMTLSENAPRHGHRFAQQ